MWIVSSIWKLFLHGSLERTMCHNCRRAMATHVKPRKGRSTIDRDHHFVDYVEVTVCGGKGGNGLMSFSSLPNVEWAGPDGGNGGNGGHVIFKASHNMKSLAHVRSKVRAPQGVNGKKKNCDGRNSEHRVVEVPIGTIIKSQQGEILSSLDDSGKLFVAARGGAGGKGNSFFLSNENRAPAIAEKGGVGQERVLHVEMKTIAHAGLIGFPNAGKSSLLRAVSRAKPRVSPYPFTTVNPHVGMIHFDDHHQIAVADIPGLIPGAHMNKGQGHSFLRHIERCSCLIYVIDLSWASPWQQLVQLRHELNAYQEGLADRPSMLIGNKTDLPGASRRLEELVQWMGTDAGQVETSPHCCLRGDGEDSDVKTQVDDEAKTEAVEGRDAKSSAAYEYEASVNLHQKLEKSESIFGIDETGNSTGQQGCRGSVKTIIGVSAKKGHGIDELLRHLRNMYDLYSSSTSSISSSSSSFNSVDTS